MKAATKRRGYLYCEYMIEVLEGKQIDEQLRR